MAAGERRLGEVPVLVEPRRAVVMGSVVAEAKLARRLTLAVNPLNRLGAQICGQRRLEAMRSNETSGPAVVARKRVHLAETTPLSKSCPD